MISPTAFALFQYNVTDGIPVPDLFFEQEENLSPLDYSDVVFHSTGHSIKAINGTTILENVAFDIVLNISVGKIFFL